MLWWSLLWSQRRSFSQNKNNKNTFLRFDMTSPFFGNMTASFFTHKWSVHLLKNEGLIWYRNFTNSDMLQDMSVERLYFTNRMLKRNTLCEHRIYSACCTWTTNLCINFLILKGFYKQHIPMKGPPSASNARSVGRNAFFWWLKRLSCLYDRN